MRLICNNLGIDIELAEDRVQVLVIENVSSYSNFVRELWTEYSGNEGDISLLDKSTGLKFGKNIEVIINPFDIDCNNKKILTKIYQEIASIIKDEKMEEAVAVNSQIIALLDDVIEKVPYSLDYNLDLNLQGLLKLYDLTVKSDAESYPELLSQYMDLMARACGVRCFIFVGLKKYLTSEDIETLYRDVIYDKIYLVDIESEIVQNSSLENVTILDRDHCLIVY